METTYDELFLLFMNICMIPPSKLPPTDQGKYDLINTAVSLFNNKMDVEYVCNDGNENLNVKATPNEKLIIAHYLSLLYFQNEMSFFTAIFSVFQKEIGIKDYQAQVKAKEANILRTEKKIDELITNSQGFTIM